MKSRFVTSRLALTLVAFGAATASAQVTEYTDQAAFNAATTGLTTYNFEGIAPAGSFVPGDVTIGGVTFTGGSGLDFAIDANAGLGQYGASFFSGQSFNPGVDPSEVVCTLSGASAFGFVYADYADAGGTPFTVSLSDGSSFTLTTPFDAGLETGFVGFLSSTPITSVKFDDAGAAFDVIQFARSVPEPGPLVLMATGLLGMVFLFRRRRTVQPARAS
jgi:PEP-CTERM motif